MTLAVQPMVKTSYTERGNEYKESNIGKYAAGAGVIGAGAVYGGEYAFKGAKKIYNKAKVIKLDIPKIEKPDFKKVVDSAKNLKNKIPSMESVKVFVKEMPAKMMDIAKKIVESAKQGCDFVKANAKKVNMGNIKKAGNSVVDFVKSNAKKINVENLKQAGASVVEFAKKPSVKYGAGVAAGLAGVVALGYLADAIANKISARKADKA